MRCYKVLGIYDDLVSEGTVIREEADGFKFLLDLKKRGRSRRGLGGDPDTAQGIGSGASRVHRNQSQVTAANNGKRMAPDHSI